MNNVFICLNTSYSLARCFQRCFITLVVLYFALLLPPRKSSTLQILQIAVGLVGLASVKYLHSDDILLLAPTTLLALYSRLCYQSI